jgi:2-hydroxychromene-2-carboxylate isomerase
MANEPEIEFFFDVASPYSYLASTQIDELEAETGVPVRWRPFLLGGVFESVGNSAPARLRPKARYMLEDLNRWADRYDIPFEMPSNFPVNSLSAQRVLVAAGERGQEAVVRLAHRLFEDYWVEGRDVSDTRVVAEAADAVGLDGDEMLDWTERDRIKDKLRSNSDEAVERGAFGAPTFFVGDEMFWGNDRLDFVREAAERVAED